MINIPAVLKSILKKLKSLFILQTKDSEESKTGEAEPENSKNINCDQGGQREWGKRIRNRHYKIKKLLAQPRNIDVKQNGRVVRRMIVRRKAIYPSARRRQNINWLKTI